MQHTPSGARIQAGAGRAAQAQARKFWGEFSLAQCCRFNVSVNRLPLRIICSINPAVYREAPSSRKAARHMSLQRRQHLFVALPEGGVINVSRKPRDILHIQGREPVQKALAGIQEILLREQG